MALESGFRGVTLLRSRNKWRPKKQDLRRKFSPQISGVMVSHHNMVSLQMVLSQNGVTRNRPPPTPSYDTALTDEIKVLVSTISTFILTIFHLYLTIFHSISINLRYVNNQGCRNPGGKGGYIPQLFDCIPPNNLSMVYICIPPIVWLWWASDRRSTLEIGEKVIHSWWRPFFYLYLNSGKKVFHFWGRPFFWSSLNLLTWKKSWSSFIPPNLENTAKLG